ncbi:isoprenylcysteine carboxylmethyltransferase family protein, partial [Staphylococcus arlettae]
WLALTHIAIYVSATIEAWLQQTTMNSLSVIGLILMIFAYIILFMVIKTLGAIWTLKLYILPQHPIIKSGLFKITKHPNYFLNIVPELLGLLLLTQA